ncbi:hypothetical protein NEOC65_000949 [Neochlamydia sp. AcF65]|nr:hypothetical protein [Neochlamydia sp. AcF65]
MINDLFISDSIHEIKSYLLIFAQTLCLLAHCLSITVK